MPLILCCPGVIGAQIVSFVPRTISARLRVMGVHRDVAVLGRLCSDENAAFTKPAPGYWSEAILSPPHVDLRSQMLPSGTGHRHQLLDRDRAARQFEIGDQDGALIMAHGQLIPEVLVWRSSPGAHVQTPLRPRGGADGSPGSHRLAPIEQVLPFQAERGDQTLPGSKPPVRSQPAMHPASGCSWSDPWQGHQELPWLAGWFE
jgi:hypothetical protein